jgi:glycerol-3-phosphate dehydrogenase (NAD(P)+)
MVIQFPGGIEARPLSRNLRSGKHNPHYLTSVHFDVEKLGLTSSAEEVINRSDVVIVAIPSSFASEVLLTLPPTSFRGKKIVSAIKGILPMENVLLNDYLFQHFGLGLENYFAVLGPCHAEEIAAEKLSYLTFAGIDPVITKKIADHFGNAYLNTVINGDIYGVQYAAVLKNIYAVGAASRMVWNMEIIF